MESMLVWETFKTLVEYWDREDIGPDMYIQYSLVKMHEKEKKEKKGNVRLLVKHNIAFKICTDSFYLRLERNPEHETS